MKWINLEDERPKPCVDILFSDGKKVYAGWLENYEPCEELCFVDRIGANRFDTFPEDIEWWMYLPKPPKEKKDG